MMKTQTIRTAPQTRQIERNIVYRPYIRKYTRGKYATYTDGEQNYRHHTEITCKKWKLKWEYGDTTGLEWKK